MLFPYDETQIHFLETVVQPFLGSNQTIRCGKSSIRSRSYLDIGCGTGTILSHFSTYFKKCYGIDNDDGILSLAAKKMLPGMKNSIELLDKSMTDIGDVFREEEFSFVTCLGNTLPHLASKDQVQVFFQQVKNRLEGAGVFIFQTINYDRIVKNNIHSLPSIQRGEVEFIRNYSAISEEGHISFDSILIDPEKEEIRNSTSLLALFKDDLEKWLQSVGFSEISFFGDYTGQPWFSESFLTIGVCEIP